MNNTITVFEFIDLVVRRLGVNAVLKITTNSSGVYITIQHNGFENSKYLTFLEMRQSNYDIIYDTLNSIIVEFERRENENA